MHLLAALGSVLRARREKLRLSQQELGTESGFDRTYISGIERGVRNPTIASLAQLCETLGVKPSQVLRSAENEAEM